MGKNRSARSKTTVRSKRVGPLKSGGAPLLGSHSDIFHWFSSFALLSWHIKLSIMNFLLLVFDFTQCGFRFLWMEKGGGWLVCIQMVKSFGITKWSGDVTLERSQCLSSLKVVIIANPQHLQNTQPCFHVCYPFDLLSYKFRFSTDCLVPILRKAKQLLNGCWLVPPSKCRQNKAQIWENCERYICNLSAAKVAREVTGNGNAWSKITTIPYPAP